jgi:hypothetical protein
VSSYFLGPGLAPSADFTALALVQRDEHADAPVYAVRYCAASESQESRVPFGTQVFLLLDSTRSSG